MPLKILQVSNPNVEEDRSHAFAYGLQMSTNQRSFEKKKNVTVSANIQYKIKIEDAHPAENSGRAARRRLTAF